MPDNVYVAELICLCIGLDGIPYMADIGMVDSVAHSPSALGGEPVT